MKIRIRKPLKCLIVSLLFSFAWMGIAGAQLSSQLGVLDLTANGGINPNTGVAWVAGDQYRLAFHTANKFEADNTDITTYNTIVTTEANLNAALTGSTWKAMITTETVNVKDNTGTADQTDGAGVGGAGLPVYAMDGTTAIARNNADIWNAWSNPFDGDAVIRLASGTTNNDSGGNPVVASQNVHYSPFLDQFGLGDSANVHGVEVWTGSQVNGNALSGQEVGHDPNTNWGSSNANNTGRVWNRGNSNSGLRSFYAISDPLTVVDTSDATPPTLTSIEDDKAGGPVFISETVTYSVTFSEAMDAGTVTTDDFEITGTAAATIDSVNTTGDASVFNVLVTPSGTGTMRLQIKQGAGLEDLAENPLDTGVALPDDTAITVNEDNVAPTVVSIVDDVAGAPILEGASVTYTVTFSEAMSTLR